MLPYVKYTLNDMKTIKILVFVIMGIIPIHAMCQDSFRTTGFGITMGGNISSTFTGSVTGASYTAKMKPCLQGGVFMYGRLSDKSIFRLSLSLNEKGNSYTITSSGYSVNANVSRLYVQFSPAECYYFYNKEILSAYLKVGPYLSLGWKSRSRIMGTLLSNYNGSEKRFDCGEIVGVGVDFGKHFGAVVELTTGILNISKSDPSMYNYNVQLSLEYKF